MLRPSCTIEFGSGFPAPSICRRSFNSCALTSDGGPRRRATGAAFKLQQDRADEGKEFKWRTKKCNGY